MPDFLDEATISVAAGNGGNGVVHFRREKYVPYGGPDGGDGGRGGSVYLVGDPQENTLLTFQYKRRFQAEHGAPGAGARKHGKAGNDLRLPVPLGTVVYDLGPGEQPPGGEGERLADLVEPDQEVMVTRGGRGGLGNVHFATPVNQAPRTAQRGEPGERRWLRLELKLIADVGLIGKPNAGKSTLLASISAARPKIADYPFTTLVPNLGVVAVGDFTFVVADIPGLIEGAHRGVGLGHEFLRHVERTRILIHVVDGGSEDPIDDFEQVNGELELYDPALRVKPHFVAINKIDLPHVRERAPELTARFRSLGAEVFSISAATGEGVQPLVETAARSLRAVPPAAITPPEELPVVRPRAVETFQVERLNGTFLVRGRLAERAVAMTDLANREARRLLRRQLERMGVTRALERAGVTPGDLVQFGDFEVEWPV